MAGMAPAAARSASSRACPLDRRADIRPSPASSAGRPPLRADATFCRRCGLPYGAPPRADAELPVCPVCYVTVDDDGRLPEPRPSRACASTSSATSTEHDRHPVGDDDWLEIAPRGRPIRMGPLVGARSTSSGATS